MTSDRTSFALNISKINLQNWEYRNEPAPDSAEEEIVKVLKQPRDWV